MAQLLDQLSEQDILLFDRVINAAQVEDEIIPERREHLGRLRYVALDAIRLQPEADLPSWLRLHSLNLLQGAADASSGGVNFARDDNSKLQDGVIITSLGSMLHRWIAEPEPGP